MLDVYIIVSFIMIIAGAFTVFFAGWIVTKFDLKKSIQTEFEQQLEEDELEEFKYNKAIVKVKIIGMLIATPGFVILFLILK